MPKVTTLWKWVAVTVVIGMLVTLVLSFTGRAKFQTKDEIRAASAQLFEFGAVGFFTKDGDMPVFERVRNGDMLDATTDCEYKSIYTKRVADKAWLLSKLDQNITYQTDFAPQSPNNCGEWGLRGYHDIHDLSARNNIENIDQNISALAHRSWFTKLVMTNDINKDLADLITHFAPATHAMGVHDPRFAPAIADPVLTAQYNQMTQGFKAAQFAQVNSCDYWQGVDQAIDAYVELVDYVQGHEQSALGPFSRALAGNWLSLQTIAPRIDTSAPLRPRPATCPKS